MTITAIKGGTLVDRDGERRLDLLVDSDSGEIVEVGSGLDGDVTLDASGCLVSSGLIDLHAQLAEPGIEAAETILESSEMAALGGFTSLVAEPYTDPCLDSTAALAEARSLSRGASARIVPAATTSVGGRGEALTSMAELVAAGVRVFSDDASPDSGFVRRFMEYLSTLAPDESSPLVLSLLCEDQTLAPGWVMHEGPTSSELGLAGQPSQAEETIVARALALGCLTGARIHIRSLSSSAGVELVRLAKLQGQAVSADVTVHHLLYCDEDCSGYDPRFKFRPPLRRAADREALRSGVADGTIDSISTHHQPYSADSLDMAFDQAPFGCPGLTTSLASAWTDLDLGFARLVELMSWAPAAILGSHGNHPVVIEPGRVADLLVFDPEIKWTPEQRHLSSMERQSPTYRQTLTGLVRHTILGGSPTVIDRELVS